MQEISPPTSQLDEFIYSDLRTMARAVNYRRWIYSKAEPYLGTNVLEVGGGIGSYTELFPPSVELVTLEPNPMCASLLRERFARRPGRSIVQSTLEEFALQHRRFDSMICLNVLEHIEDDENAIRQMAAMLVPGGALVLLLPANRLLYGSVDRELGHFRRYGRVEARRVAAAGSLRVERLECMNVVGFFGWLINARLLKRGAQSPAQVDFYDRVVVPIMRRVERILPPPFGQSIFMVLRAPGHSA